MPFAHVVFPLPVHRTFAYAVPEPLEPGLRIGSQVLAPFRGRPTPGFVVELTRESGIDRALPLARVLDPNAVSPHLLELARWIADYYVAPLGEVLSAAI